MTERVLVLLGMAAAFVLLGLWLRAHPRRLTTVLDIRALKVTLGLDGLPALLAFTSPDCAPCRVLQKPAIDRLARETPSAFAVREVDVVARPEIAAAFRIFTLPSTVVLTAAGEVAAVNIGFAPADRLRRQLDAAARPPQ